MVLLGRLLLAALALAVLVLTGVGWAAQAAPSPTAGTGVCLVHDAQCVAVP